MAQDSTPSMVMYIGDGTQTRFEVPFDKGSFGEIKVAFVRRGLTDYTYNPDTYTVDGYLYAWNGGVYTKTEQPTTSTPLYDKTGVATGDNWEEGMYREPKNDIFTQAVVEWTGDTLTTNDVICITRETEADQPYTYQNNQKHIERALDNLARQIQELGKASQNSLKVDPAWMPIAEGGTNDSDKMDPIAWLQTIVRSKGGTLRELRVNEGYIEYTADDPDASSKTWEVVAGVKTGNAGVISHFREYQQTVDNTTVKYLQYSVDGGSTWSTVSSSVAFENISGQPTDNAALDAALDAKQDVISDLSDIRSGAAAGATAVQPADLATVATTGAYSDLTGTPSIPTVNDTTITFTQGGVTKGTITLNQSSDETIALDAGGGGGTDLPDQTGHSGEFLTTNGTAASWSAVPTEIPTQTGQSGKFLTTDGSAASWSGIAYSDVSGTPSLATVATSGAYSDLSGTPSIPTVNDSTITITQGGVTKGTFTTNQGSASTIALDAGGGGSSTPQSIDAEIYGSVTVSGNDISNFSTGDYVRVPGAFQFKDASSFEIVGAFTTNANSGSQMILCPTNGWLVYMMSGIRIMNSLTDGQQLLHVTIWPDKTTTLTSQSFRGTTNLAANTKYYIKLTYDGTDYKLYLSTDGVNYALEASDTATYLPETNANGYYLGPRPDSTGTMIAILHMDTWSIKKDTVTVWAGVDAPGLHQRAESSHEVIAFQSPTAGNNYTWYRKYADGWVEQGGYATTSGNTGAQITLPVTMSDAHYLINGTCDNDATGGVFHFMIYENQTTTGFVASPAYAGEWRTGAFYWEVRGMAAN